MELHTELSACRDAEALMVRAYERCPYSKSTRGNVDVSLTVDGQSLERLAA
jgi:organic hydroperoxide reductase OsmC/OhrA